MAVLNYNSSILTRNSYWLEYTTPPSPYPGDLAPFTIRFRFDDASFDPRSLSWNTGVQLTRVSSEPNVWDLYYADPNWYELVKGKFVTGNYAVHVLDSNLTGVAVCEYLFSGNTRINSINLRGMSTVITLSHGFDANNNLATVAISDVDSLYTLESAFEGDESLTTVTIGRTTESLERVEHCFDSCYRLTALPNLEMSGVKSLLDFAADCWAITTVPLYSTSNVTSFRETFNGCRNLVTVPAFDYSKVTQINDCFRYCRSITTLPQINSGVCLDFSMAFAECESLETLPSIDTTSAVDVGAMFEGCRNVTSGSLALYNQLSGQAFPPTKHAFCFRYCGENTVTGAAELAKIPQDWGGTAT